MIDSVVSAARPFCSLGSTVEKRVSEAHRSVAAGTKGSQSVRVDDEVGEKENGRRGRIARVDAVSSTERNRIPGPSQRGSGVLAASVPAFRYSASIGTVPVDGCVLTVRRPSWSA
jgi:hypothetical protein